MYLPSAWFSEVMSVTPENEPNQRGWQGWDLYIYDVEFGRLRPNSLSNNTALVLFQNADTLAVPILV